jgi:CRISPR-associated protein Csx10
VLFEADADAAQSIIASVTERALREAPGLSVVGVFVPMEVVPDLSQAERLVRSLHELHERHRQAIPAATHRFQQLPFTAKCPESGRPAVSGKDRLSAQARAARQAADKLGVVGERDIDEIGAYVGVIHADGNGFGNVFGRLGSLLVEHGYTTDEPLRALLAVSRWLSELLDRAVRDAWTVAAPEASKRVVVLGGDDLTAIVPGGQAVSITHNYLVAFADACRDGLKKLASIASDPSLYRDGIVAAPADVLRTIVTDGFSATAGVAIVKAGLPLSAAYDIAETLAARAKVVGRETRPGGVLPALCDIHVVHDSSVTDVLTLLDRRSVPGLGLRGGPYASVVEGQTQLARTETLLSTTHALTTGGWRGATYQSTQPCDRTVLVDVIDLAGLSDASERERRSDDSTSLMRLLQKMRSEVSLRGTDGLQVLANRVRDRQLADAHSIASLLSSVLPGDALARTLMGEDSGWPEASEPLVALAPSITRPALSGGYRFKVTVLSPMHIGTGRGDAVYVDRAVARTSLGDHEVVFVPGKTLTGRIRESAEHAATVLDGRSGGPWWRFSQELFGRRLLEKSGPGAANLEIRPAFPTTPVPTAIRASNSIDEATGIAADDHLVAREVVNAGAVFEGVVTLPTNRNRAAECLVLAAANLTDALGARTSRGLGWCDIQLMGPDSARVPEPSEAEIDELTLSLATQPDKPRPVERRATSDADRGKRDLDLSLVLRTELPVIAERNLIGNEWQTYDYLPGRLLLPLVDRFLSEHGLELDAEWLATGSLRVTDAVPSVVGSHGPVRCAAGPRALGKPKQRDGKARVVFDAETTEQLVAVTGWWPRDVRQWPLDQPTVRLVSNMHVDATTKDDTGRLFTYQAIASGQDFHAVVRLPAPVVGALGGEAFALAAWVSWLERRGGWKVGRSSKDDYGLVSLSGGSSADSGVPRARLGKDGRVETILWLTSPFTGRGPTGRDEATLEVLARYLTEVLDGVEFVGTRARPARFDSWQRRWGMPRPTIPAIAPGTCVMLRFSDGDLDRRVSQLTALARDGLGDRRAEGFGELVFFDGQEGVPA